MSYRTLAIFQTFVLILTSLIALAPPARAENSEADITLLQAENRMLKAQVASLKRKLEGKKIPIKVKPVAGTNPKTLQIMKLTENDSKWWRDISKFDLQARLRTAIEDHAPKEGFTSWVKRNRGFAGKKIQWKMQSLSILNPPSSVLSQQQATIDKLKTESKLKANREALVDLDVNSDRRASTEKRISKLEHEISFFKKVISLGRNVTIRRVAYKGVTVRVIIADDDKDKKFYRRYFRGKKEPNVQGEILNVHHRQINYSGGTALGITVKSTFAFIDVIGQVINTPANSQKKK